MILAVVSNNTPPANNQMSLGERHMVISDGCCSCFRSPRPIRALLLVFVGQIVDQLLGTTEQSMKSEGDSDCKILANQAGRLSVSCRCVSNGSRFWV